MSYSKTNGTPPRGNDWGERTIQSCRTHDAPGYWKSDAYEIRQCYNIPRFDVDEFLEAKLGHPVYPDIISHSRNPERTPTDKGTPVFILGKKSSGKTTLARHLSCRHMDAALGNPEIVVWRGREQSSGWLPYAPWTTLYLPANAEIDAHWLHEDDDTTLDEVDVDALEAEVGVRDVIRYDDVYDLLDELSDGPEGTFNVIYPDPSFSGCEEVIEKSPRVAGSLPFTPAWKVDQEDDEVPTRTVHWWFAFLTARTEYGPMKWMSVHFDEAGDFVPEHASNDDSRLWDKIELLRSLWAASRKRMVSLYFYAHRGDNVHSEIRKEFETWIHMPGRANPVENVRGTWPLGASSVPMNTDSLVKREDPGTGLCWNEQEFSVFGWEDVSVPEDHPDATRWLRIRLSRPSGASDSTSESAAREPEWSEQIWAEWQNQVNHRLYVKEPGDGYVDVDAAEIGEPLSSPLEGWVFREELRERDGFREVLLEEIDGDRVEVVARLPLAEMSDLASDGETEVAG